MMMYCREKMNSKDQTILEIFYVRESSNLICIEFENQYSRTRLLNYLTLPVPIPDEEKNLS